MTSRTVSIFLFSIVALCNACSQSAQSYDDCVLSYSSSAKTNKALDAVKTSCKSKFPLVIDFEQKARDAGVDSWGIVSRKSEFQSKSNEIKEEIRKQYFSDVVQPRVHPDFLNEAATQFESYARRVEKSVRSDAQQGIQPSAPASDGRTD